jgi:hypothetical protein
MTNTAKFVIITTALGCYGWYLGSLKTTIDTQMAQMSSSYVNAGQIAAQELK